MFTQQIDFQKIQQQPENRTTKPTCHFGWKVDPRICECILLLFLITSWGEKPPAYWHSLAWQQPSQMWFAPSTPREEGRATPAYAIKRTLSLWWGQHEQHVTVDLLRCQVHSSPHKSENCVSHATQTALYPMDPWPALQLQTRGSARKGFSAPWVLKEKRFLLIVFTLSWCRDALLLLAPAPVPSTDRSYRSSQPLSGRYRGLSGRWTLQLNIHNHFAKNIPFNCSKHDSSHFGPLWPEEEMGQAYPICCYN